MRVFAGILLCGLLASNGTAQPGVVGYVAGYSYPTYYSPWYPYWPGYPGSPYYGPYAANPLYPPMPNVTMVYEQPPRVVYVPGAGDSEAVANPSATRGSPMYLLAFNDHTIHPAIAYRLEGRTLHYLTRQGDERTVPFDFLDATLTVRLNRERNIAIVLPEQATRFARDTRILAEQADIAFRFNSSELDENAKLALNLLIRRILAMPQPAVELLGFTDSAGSESYNLALSRRRAESVQRYMVLHSVPLRWIDIIGLGEESVSGRGTADREVQNSKPNCPGLPPDSARRVLIQVYSAGVSLAAGQELP